MFYPVHFHNLYMNQLKERKERKQGCMGTIHLETLYFLWSSFPLMKILSVIVGFFSIRTQNMMQNFTLVKCLWINKEEPKPCLYHTMNMLKNRHLTMNTNEAFLAFDTNLNWKLKELQVFALPHWLHLSLLGLVLVWAVLAFKHKL